jgi:hypothetical protein
MRGAGTFTESLFTMRRLEDFVPADHPLRAVRALVNEALIRMDGLFSRMFEADIKRGRTACSNGLNNVNLEYQLATVSAQSTI